MRPAERTSSNATSPHRQLPPAILLEEARALALADALALAGRFLVEVLRAFAVTSDFLVLGERVGDRVPRRFRAYETMTLGLDAELTVEVPRRTKSNARIRLDHGHHGTALTAKRPLAVRRRLIGGQRALAGNPAEVAERHGHERRE